MFAVLFSIKILINTPRNRPIDLLNRKAVWSYQTTANFDLRAKLIKFYLFIFFCKFIDRLRDVLIRICVFMYLRYKLTKRPLIPSDISSKTNPNKNYI